jgi:hypothetical protein
MRIKNLFILAFLLINTHQIIAQNQEKLIQKFTNELCDSLSAQLSTIDDLKKYIAVVDSFDHVFFKKTLKTPEFEQLVRLISNEEPQFNPYMLAVERIVNANQANCSFFTKYFGLTEPVKKSIIQVGDSACNCMNLSLTERERKYADASMYTKNFQTCGISAIKFQPYTTQARIDFDLVKNPTAFDKQLSAYIFTKCRPIVASFALGRASGLRINLSNLWLKSSKTLVNNALQNKLNDTLENVFISKKVFENSFIELIKGRKILPEECGYSQTFLKTKDAFVHLFTFSSWKVNKVAGQYKVEYDKDGFGKIKRVTFLEPKDISNLAELNAELAKFPPPPPPPPPSFPPIGKN